MDVGDLPILALNERRLVVLTNLKSSGGAWQRYRYFFSLLRKLHQPFLPQHFYQPKTRKKGTGLSKLPGFTQPG